MTDTAEFVAPVEEHPSQLQQGPPVRRGSTSEQCARIRPGLRPSATRAAAAARVLAGTKAAGVYQIASTALAEAAADSAGSQVATGPITPGGPTPPGGATRPGSLAATTGVATATTTGAAVTTGVVGTNVAVATSAAAADKAQALPVPGEKPPKLRVVETVKLTPAQRQRRARALLLAAASLAVVVALGLVYFHVVLAQRQFALNRLDTTVQNERANYERLRLQVAELGSPQHIISTAVGQLGMRQPASVDYLTPSAAAAGVAHPNGDPSSGLAAGVAPAGDADWPLIKSQLAGSP
jgi:cell division protein FtsL